ncbi:hypothetical protein [Mangrovihabitans endophyticus]|uniref:HTH cro/C1-type domain-containing protein n=1 Tax=Mangrovihabitans endophyticus TaxID=1751298 RepID=A0A8J3C2E3_9ACTN|nr:hypothetical protein [Mangrovihabitans endophyticus]GGL00185.1 hypothetical protein GCM10012284_38280 [Mangrovihabitans endophyticus]
MDEKAHEPADSLATKINRLFATIRPRPEEIRRGRHGREYFNSEVADRINGPGEVADRIRRAVGEVTISGAYIGELRQGKVTDPRLSHLKALAIAFGVPVGYLVEDVDPGSAAEVTRDLERLDQLRRVGAQQVLLRDVLAGTGLSDRSQAAMTAIFEQLLEVEGIVGDQRPGPGSQP